MPRNQWSALVATGSVSGLSGAHGGSTLCILSRQRCISNCIIPEKRSQLDEYLQF